jgi:dipeptide transport system ATP-binding protein
MVPGRDDRPRGCLFAPRCKYVVDDCMKARPALGPLPDHGEGTQVRCIKPLNLTGDANVHTKAQPHGGAR